jgi:hypothetical protein
LPLIALLGCVSIVAMLFAIAQDHGLAVPDESPRPMTVSQSGRPSAPPVD